MTTPNNTMKVLEVCNIGPPPCSVPNNSLPLTFLDLFPFAMRPSQVLFFYNFPHSNTHFTDSLLPRIKHSLSLTLQHYYPLAGNLVWPFDTDKPMIKYVDGDSVALTVAESKDDFYHLSSDHAKDASECYPLVPHLPVIGEIVPMLALQVTLFPNFGISIGLTVHHGGVDGKISLQFMKSWASVCRLGDTTLLIQDPMSYDKTLIKDPHGLETIYLNDLRKFFNSESNPKSQYRKLKVVELELPPNLVRAIFELNEANIAKLKKWVLARYNNDEQRPPPRISTFVVMCAYVWVCLVKSEGEVSENDIAFFAIPVDCRARLDPPIPSNYFGNCQTGAIAIRKRTDIMGQDGIVMAAESIREAIKGLDNGILNGDLCDANLCSGVLSMKPQRANSASGSPRFGVYETDFGLGKPKKVEMVSNDRTGGVFFAESRKGDGGIEIGLVLNKSEMETFTSVFIDGLNAL